jgi:carboxyl-terminal processing protease
LPARLPGCAGLLLLLAGFAAGVFADRRGWVPLRYNRQPARLDRTFAPFWEAWHDVQEHFVDREKVDDKRMTEGAIRGMLNSLGDVGHTSYLTKEQYEEQKKRLSGELEGIGAILSVQAKRPTIVRTLPGSPARAAGVRAGDVVLAVDGKSVANLTLNEVVARIKGPAGTKVRLGLRATGTKADREVTVERAKVERPEVEWWMLPGPPQAKGAGAGGVIAHIALDSFGDKAHEQLRKAISEAKGKGAKAILLDLRNNGGGYKEQALKVASELIPAGRVVLIKQDAKGRRTEFKAELKGEERGLATDLPLCVLINSASASSSEIVAGAIQGNRRGKLVGERTYGAGTILRSYELSDGGAIWLAVYEWLTPTGESIWHKGVSPDKGLEVSLPPGAIFLHPNPEAPLTPEAFAKSTDTQVLKGYEVLMKELK